MATGHQEAFARRNQEALNEYLNEDKKEKAIVYELFEEITEINLPDEIKVANKNGNPFFCLYESSQDLVKQLSLDYLIYYEPGG